jgi:hypothetical protein
MESCSSQSVYRPDALSQSSTLPPNPTQGQEGDGGNWEVDNVAPHDPKFGFDQDVGDCDGPLDLDPFLDASLLGDPTFTTDAELSALFLSQQSDPDGHQLLASTDLGTATGPITNATNPTANTEAHVPSSVLQNKAWENVQQFGGDETPVPSSTALAEHRAESSSPAKDVRVATLQPPSPLAALESLLQQLGSLVQQADKASKEPLDIGGDSNPRDRQVSSIAFPTTDVGSMCSWRSDDEHLLVQFNTWLREADLYGPSLYVSPSLPHKRRMQIHAVANIHGLSHMSVHSGTMKRVLATPFCISPHTGNGTRRGWKLGWDERLYVDPSIVCLGVPGNSEFDVQAFVGQATFEEFQPIAAPQELISSQQEGVGSTFVMQYNSAGDALRAFLAFDGRISHGIQLRVDYAVMHDSYCVGTTRQTSKQLLASPLKTLIHKRLAAVGTLNRGLRDPMSRTSLKDVPSNRALRKDVYSRSTMNLGQREYPPVSYQRAVSAPPIHSSELSRGPSRTTTMHSDKASRTRQRSNSGFSVDGDSHYSVASSANKRQKRSARQESGYECGACGKLFDLQSERDKHWRNVHGPRSHACGVCGKAFVYAKDVERHMSVHAKDSRVEESISKPREEVGSLISESNKSPWRVKLQEVNRSARRRLTKKRFS